jgi:hypothetical protein
VTDTGVPRRRILGEKDLVSKCNGDVRGSEVCVGALRTVTFGPALGTHIAYYSMLLLLLSLWGVLQLMLLEAPRPYGLLY